LYHTLSHFSHHIFMLFMKNNKNTTGGVHPIPKFRRLATANSRFRLTTAGHHHRKIPKIQKNPKSTEINSPKNLFSTKNQFIPSPKISFSLMFIISILDFKP
jgi:hypothetical protein